MCGIAGILSLNGEPLGEAALTGLERMTQALAHRGPDDSGSYLDPSRLIAFGHRRLSIIDLSSHAHQPYSSYRSSLVFNGEILNYTELAHKHLGHVDPSDTVVLSSLLEHRGITILPELRGFFAFAYWDTHTSTLLLARDALGKKPLYYTVRENKLIFASELRALMQSGFIPFALDRTALDRYLAFYSVPSPLTMIDGVRMLEPGHYLEVRDGKIEKERWWMLPAYEPNRHSREQNVADLRSRFNDAVSSRLLSDAPLGVFHSGGIDSNLLLAAAHDIGSSPLSTFNVRFESTGSPNTSNDESKVARISSERFSTFHSELSITESDVERLLPSFFYRMDSPTGDGLNTFIISHAVRMARPDIKVVLSGIGGDELFVGYKKTRLLAKNMVLGSMLRAVGMQILASSAWTTSRVLNTLASLADPLQMRVLFSNNERARLLGHEVSDEVVTRHSKLGESLPLHLLRQDIEQYLPHTLLRDLDAMTMAHSQEARAPFLDRSFVEFAWQIPLEQKLQGDTKHMLLDAYDDLLPREVIEKKKTGFELPMSQWLRTGGLRLLLDNVLHGKLQLITDGILEKEAVQYVARDFEQGKSHYMKMWAILALEYWYRSFTSMKSYEDWCSEPWPA